MFSKIQIDWRKKEWHITTDVRTGSGVSGKKPRKKCSADEICREIEDFILELQRNYTLPQQFDMEKLTEQGAV